MELTGKQRRALRGLGHKLRPVVMVGQGGVSGPVLDKVDIELERHELIKVKVSGDAPSGPREVAAPLAEHVGAHLVQVVGGVILLYRRRKKEPEIVLARD